MLELKLIHDSISGCSKQRKQIMAGVQEIDDNGSVSSFKSKHRHYMVMVNHYSQE